MARKKIAYIIACMNKNTGIGGHYHSLLATAMMNEELFDVDIYIIGNNPCPTIEESKLSYYRINIHKNIFEAFSNLKDKINKNGIDVIHSFDLKSDIFARFVSNSLKIPKINTKCGGKPPRRFFPKQHYLILYSTEDKQYFSFTKKFKNTSIHYLPNRVYGTVKNDNVRISKLRKHDNSKFTLLRISRIASYYKQSLLQTINLHDRLIDEGIALTTFIVGKSESQELLQLLNKHVKHKELFNIVTDKYFTTKASELIDIADLVVGTGRGYMEASSKAKIMFTPIKNEEMPALVNSANFDSFFKSNFSERNNFNGFDPEQNIKEVLNVLNNKSLLESYSEFNKENFESFFNINSKKENYSTIYNNVEYIRDNYLDFILSLVIFMKGYYR